MTNEIKNKNHPFEMSEVMKPYHFIIENRSEGIRTAVLFGLKYYLKSVNFGSDPSVFVKSADPDATTLQLIKQSVIEFKPKGIRLIADSWKNMPKLMLYNNNRTGDILKISLVDSESWGIKEVLGRAVNDIPFDSIINEDTTIVFNLESRSEFELLIY